MLNKYLICKQISILYYNFEGRCGTFWSLAVRHSQSRMVMESALLTVFNSSRFEVLFIFKGKQGIFLQFV